MADDLPAGGELEIAHVLFIDVVGYSAQLIDEQSQIIAELNRLVRETPHFRSAEAADRLIRIPTGDGMALVFFNSPEAPVHCALEVARLLRTNERIKVRMGIHSGPVHSVADVNDRANVAGAGINMAQRIMDCGDAGHILVSRRIAEDLLQHGQWRPALHEVGDVEVKHGQVVSVFNLYGADFGNPAKPRRIVRPAPVQKKLAGPSFVVIGAAVVALAIAFLGYRSLKRIGSAEPKTSVALLSGDKSIAVLPFDNLSQDKQNAYFADGIQDDILTALAKVADLKVIGRSSVMRYREGNRDVGKIGRELNVFHLLEGSVRRAADQIRVSVELIDARNSVQLWAEHYDRKLSDVFAIQSELAEQIAGRLQATISPEEKAAIGLRPTSDLEAFDLFLQAKDLITTFNDTPDRKQALLRAIRLLDEAIERDPKFALAYCWATIAHDNLYWFDLDRTPNRLALAESCARTALSLNSDLGEAHLAQALVAYHGHRDYARARKHLALARRSLPNSAEVFSLTGYIDRREGHWDESLHNLEHAAELDPRNFKVLADLSVLYDLLRRYEDKERLYDREVAINPASSSYCQLLRAETALEKGDPTKAAELLSHLPQDYDPDGSATAARISVLLAQGNVTGARDVLAKCPNAELIGGTGTSLPRSYFEGQIARAANNDQGLRSAFTTARQKIEEKLRNDPDNAPWHGVLSVVQAGLGDTTGAVSEGSRAVALLPVTKDAIDGPVVEASQTMSLAWIGHKDEAVGLLTELGSRPGGPDYGQLLLDPAWRDVRSDPRFQHMLDMLKPAFR